ncbi:MAG: hypothetical protein LBK41_05180 [Clostridiales bacterium]|nr:hypothetical protein [Clostridiales bacterium]
MDVKTAQYLLGHASVQVTLEIYTHLDESAKTEQSVKFNSLKNSVIQSEISQLGDRKP